MASEELIVEFKPYIEFIKRKEENHIKKLRIQKEFEKIITLTKEESKEDLETVKLKKDNKLVDFVYELQGSYPKYTYEDFSDGKFAKEDDEEEEASPSNTEGVTTPAVVSQALPATGVSLPATGVALPATGVSLPESSSSAEVSSCGVIGRPVKAKSTLAQGDCFYSSVYRASGEGGFLPQIQECLGIEIDTEDNFIEDMRGIVGVRIVTDGHEMFEGLVDLIRKKVWHAAIEAYPLWFREAFGEGLPKEESFLKKLAGFAKTRKNDVSEIEVRLVEKILEECGIKINKYNHKIARAIPGELHLWNQREYHWVYFSFDVGERYEQSEEFIDLEYEECVRKCKEERTLKKTEAIHYSDYEAWKKNPKSRPQFEKRKGYTYDGEVFRGGKRKRQTPRKKSVVTKKRFNKTRSNSKK